MRFYKVLAFLLIDFALAHRGCRPPHDHGGDHDHHGGHDHHGDHDHHGGHGHHGDHDHHGGHGHHGGHDELTERPWLNHLARRADKLFFGTASDIPGPELQDEDYMTLLTDRKMFGQLTPANAMKVGGFPICIHAWGTRDTD